MMVLGLLLLGAAALVFLAPDAQAETQTSGAILPAPDCCQAPPGDVGTPSKTVHIGISIQSTSQIGGTFVDATVVGTTTIILGCTSASTTSSCTGTELAALTFDSCAPAAGVTSCVQDVNPNHVLITYPAGGKSVSTALGGTLVATITAHFTPGQQVVSPASGQFFLLGNTGDGNLTTTAAQGAAGGSAPLFFPPPPLQLSLNKTCTAVFNNTTKQVDVSFTSTLTNLSSFEGVGGITCSDSPTATLSGVPSALAAGASATINGTYSQSSLSAADTLTCTGTGATSGSTATINASASCTSPPPPAPGINVTKACTATFNSTTKQLDVTFTSTVTNTGTDDLTAVACSDSPAATLTGPPSTLAAGASTTVTGSYSTATVPATDTLTCSGTGVVSGTTETASANATCGHVTTVPTLSEWGMLLFIALLLGIGSLTIARRRNAASG